MLDSPWMVMSGAITVGAIPVFLWHNRLWGRSAQWLLTCPITSG